MLKKKTEEKNKDAMGKLTENEFRQLANAIQQYGRVRVARINKHGNPKHAKNDVGYLRKKYPVLNKILK